VYRLINEIASFNATTNANGTRTTHHAPRNPPMFWPFLFAHLLADYPLQTDGMVQAKKTMAGLALHIAIHFLTLLVLLNGLLGLEWRSMLPWVVMLAAFHFAIDSWKNVLAQRSPQWVIAGYGQDQLLHLLSIFLTARWQAQISQGSLFALTPSWILYACGFVVVTHGWFVTERVLAYRTRPYQEWVNATFWPRMISRALLFSVLLLGWNVSGLAALLLGLTFHRYDLSCRYRWYGLLIDLGVVLLVTLPLARVGFGSL
jgi:hypothetical protein